MLGSKNIGWGHRRAASWKGLLQVPASINYVDYSIFRELSDALIFSTGHLEQPCQKGPVRLISVIDTQYNRYDIFDI
jgi:hypothetical protein